MLSSIALLLVVALASAAAGAWLARRWRDAAAAGSAAAGERQRMLQALLDLEHRVVEDIMIPRSEVVAIDLRSSWSEILAQLDHTPHTRLPLYEGDLDQLLGVVHMKRAANELAADRLDRKRLCEIATQRPPMFVPEGTSLQQQLARFRQARRRVAFVVDEYGSIQGLVTLEDILEEVVGEFTTQPTLLHRDLQRKPDGSYLVSGSMTLRLVNRSLGWSLPTDGPRTLGGLIIEYLEAIPESGTSLRLHGHAMEVLHVVDNAIRVVRVWPAGDPPAS